MKKHNNDFYVSNLQTYMQEVDKIDLLSKDEERKLLLQVDKGKPEKASLYLRKKAEEARIKMIEANLKLVIKIAKEFRNIGLDYEDIINEGNIGLMNAVDKYNIEKGAKFSYYASFWIKQCIRRAISNKGRTIRLPVGVVEMKLKVNKYIENSDEVSAQKPNDLKISKDLNIPVAKVQNLLKLQLQSDSLNAKINENDDELGEIVPDKKGNNPSQACEQNNSQNILSDFISKLDYRQRYIIIRRFGLDGAKPETLENIGKKFDLTRERIRQLELIALRSLKEMYKGINKNKLIE